MTFKSLALAAVAALILPAAASAQAYRAPRAVGSQPSLEGTWTNATLTPLERPSALGERRAMTAAEVATIEGRRAEVVAKSLEPTKADADFEKEPCYAANTATGGAVPDCGYNAFWTDHGDAVMRVNGEPRTSMISAPRANKNERKATVIGERRLSRR